MATRVSANCLGSNEPGRLLANLGPAVKFLDLIIITPYGIQSGLLRPSEAETNLAGVHTWLVTSAIQNILDS